MAPSETWTLHHDHEVVARLRVTRSDFPWLHASVEQLPGFEDIAQLFADELQHFHDLSDVETPEWTAAYDAIRSTIRLIAPDGREAAEYLLHIDGDEAWWRWEWEPFTTGRS